MAPLRNGAFGPFALLLVAISLCYVHLRFIEISGMYTCPSLRSTGIWWIWARARYKCIVEVRCVLLATHTSTGSNRARNRRIPSG